MTGMGRADEGHEADAVERARAWLVEHTGQAPGADDLGPPRLDAGRVDPGGQDDRVDPVVLTGRADEPGPAQPARLASPADAIEGDPDGADPDADHEAVARTIALRKLTAQARTRHELDQALQKKNVPDAVAASVLDRLEEVGLVDDETFARDWVASRQRRRHLSRSALRRQLQGKGVDRDHVDSALASVDTEDELSAARALAAKKVSAMRGLEPLVRRRRLAGVLARRGFGSAIIGTVVSEFESSLADEPGA